MVADDGPTRGDAERRPEQHVAEEMTVVVQPRGGNVPRNEEGRPGMAVAEMALEHRRGREGDRGVAGRERTALAGRPVALRRVLDAVGQALYERLRAKE